MMRPVLILLLVLCVFCGAVYGKDATILEVENIVQRADQGIGRWVEAKKGQTLVVADRIRTRQKSRATVRLTGLYTLRMDQFTTIKITPGLVGGGKPKLDLSGGAAFIFSRDRGGEIDIGTPAANAALRGTQLFVRVGEGGKTSVQVIEGEVELENGQGRLLLAAGEAGEVEPGQAPKRTAVIEVVSLLQWALYYPAVVDLGDLGLSEVEGGRVAASLEAYRAGDVLAALELLPEGAPGSEAGWLYRAAVLVAVGRVDEASVAMGNVAEGSAGRVALERLFAAVQGRGLDGGEGEALGSASEALAASYYRQSRGDLEGALVAASEAVALSPGNGFAWTRVGELEFSFGHLDEANAALERGLELSPRNARAHALRGFVASGRNRLKEAAEAFARAVELDGAFGNGWLGSGLVKIRRGDLEAGREDLQTATTVEPTVSLFHSYLGKAFSQEGLGLRAAQDLALAKELDPGDPTPWLYSAIDLQQGNRVNEAIGDLEESIRLNDNRRIYRSGFLLDQDRAVRGANLAKLYQDAGMSEVAVREATRAVENDYTNPSAHLFLANSFDALRDPTRISLRYETPWFNELLLANLLSPVGGGALSQYVSQQEYSKLLESDGLGGSVWSEWRSDAQVRGNVSLYGTFGDVSFGLDGSYREDEGGRLNSDASLRELYAQLKWQATEDDIFYFLGKWSAQDSGDNFQTYDNAPLSPGFEFEESQEPGLLLGGWNHRWDEGHHTLLLGGRLSAEQTLSDPLTNQLLLRRDDAAFRPGLIRQDEYFTDEFSDATLRDAVVPPVMLAPDYLSQSYSPALRSALAPYLGTGGITGLDNAPFSFETYREFEVNTLELQHILQGDWNTMILGGRWQEGEFRTDAWLRQVGPGFFGAFETPASEQLGIETEFERRTLYAYDYLEVLPQLTLIGGVTWDWIEHPENFRNPPVTEVTREDERVSGKAGFSFHPSKWLRVRGAYTEGLGGVSFDESVRLEPVQVAGFNQAFRTVISESLAGSVEVPEYQTWGLSVEGQLPTRTWWGLAVNVIEQDVERSLGAFDGYDSGIFPISPAYFPGQVSQELSYREESFSATLNQLVTDQFSLGAGYRVTRSRLRTLFPGIAGSGLDPVVTGAADLEDEATLHEISASANWNSPSGLFARIEGNWITQQLEDDPAGRLPGVEGRHGDGFVLVNALVGYRFARKRCEISAGVLNLLGEDYRLSPLTPHRNFAREPTFLVRCRMSF